jgi:hypothetical protein
VSAKLLIMHHVVFAVAPERVDAPVEFSESLGFQLNSAPTSARR